jgi:hypothetical protein
LARKFPAQNKRNRIEESFLFYFERMFLPMNKIEFVLDWNTCEETPLILGLWTSSGFLWLYVSFIDVTRRFPLPSYFDFKYLPNITVPANERTYTCCDFHFTFLMVFFYSFFGVIMNSNQTKFFVSCRSRTAVAPLERMKILLQVSLFGCLDLHMY